MFDSHGHLIVPTAIIGGGAYGTVYIAKRYNAAISNLVCDYLHYVDAADPKRQGDQKESRDGKGMGTDTLPTSSTRPTMRDNTEGVDRVVESGTLRPNDVPTHGMKERIAKAANATEQALRSQVGSAGGAPPYMLVAVKEVTFDLLPDDLDDVLKEVSFMRGMCHENIIGFISSFLHGGTYGGGVPRREARRAQRSPQTSARDCEAHDDEKEGATRFESSFSPSKAAGPANITAIEVSLSSVALKPTKDMEALAKRAMKELGLSSSQVGKGTWDKTLKQKLLSSSSSHYFRSSTGGGSHTNKEAGGRKPAETFSPLPSMCVVEELADGPSLAELIVIRQTKDDSGTPRKSGANADSNGGSLGPLNSEELAAVLQHTLRALDYLHSEARIVHRDVKCANIALDARSGTAKLLDFGTCGAIDNPNVTRHTVLGTPGWIAPEVLAGGVVSTADGMGARLGYGFRSDLWSFGVTVLELTFLRDARAAQSDPFFAKAIKFLSQMQCSASEEMRAALEENESTSRGARGGGVTKGELTHFIIPPPSAASPFAFQSNEKLFTPLLQDLIACCLRRNPALRPSAAELLRHPYFTETLGGGSGENVDKTIDTKNIIKDLVRQAVAVCEAAKSSAASKNKGDEKNLPPFSRPSLCDHASTVGPTALGISNDYGGTALRAPYPMQFLEMFTHTYSEAATLQRLNEANAAASMAVLKDVLVPAARAAPVMAIEIQQKFKTAIALQSGVPLASLAPSSPPYTPSPPCPPEGAPPSSSSASPPPLTRGGILPPEIQAQLQHLALGYHAEDPERHRRATVLMEQHVELLYKMESKLPGFAEKFAAKFIELLVTEHPEGGDVVANALQMMSRLRSDVLKPDMLPSFDPTGDSIEATTDPSKEQKPPIIIKMPSSPAVLDTVASSSPSLNKNESKGDGGDGEKLIDPTAFLFNQVVDHYAASGAAGGVGLAGGPSQQHVSRFAGLL